MKSAIKFLKEAPVATGIAVVSSVAFCALLLPMLPPVTFAAAAVVFAAAVAVAASYIQLKFFSR